MLTVFQQWSLLVTAYVLHGIFAQNCSTGWFGENCMYQCHCTIPTNCLSTGLCSDGKCESYYYGPACQYVDLVTNYTANTIDSYLRDKNDSTCNPDLTSTFVTVVLREAISFLGFRIVVNNPANILSFTAHINEVYSCVNERRFQTGSVLDVTCETDIYIEKLKISGAIAPAVCSVYINGGRNVAIKQYTNQTTTYTDVHGPTISSRAVDGVIDQTLERDSCSSTEEESTPGWAVHYNRPQIIYRVIVQNRNHIRQRMTHFTLTGFDESGNHTFFHQDNHTMTDYIDTYWINFKGRNVTTSVQVSLPSMGGQRILTMCEVQTFGETICPDGKFGLWCQETCQCFPEQACYVATGGCAEGCQYGYYGYGCATKCPDTCGACSISNGTCLTPPCPQECALDTHGDVCKRNCSQECNDTCLFRNVNCTCLHIEEPTTPNTLNASNVTCPEKTYGPKCESKCPMNCANGMCDVKSGNCASCTGDFTGEKCDIGKSLGEDSGSSSAGMVGIVAVVLLLLAIALVALFTIRKGQAEPTQCEARGNE